MHQTPAALSMDPLERPSLISMITWFHLHTAVSRAASGRVAAFSITGLRTAMFSSHCTVDGSMFKTPSQLEAIECPRSIASCPCINHHVATNSDTIRQTSESHGMRTHAFARTCVTAICMTVIGWLLYAPNSKMGLVKSTKRKGHQDRSLEPVLANISAQHVNRCCLLHACWQPPWQQGMP